MTALGGRRRAACHVGGSAHIPPAFIIASTSRAFFVRIPAATWPGSADINPTYWRDLHF
jgi:hypothetical protein